MSWHIRLLPGDKKTLIDKANYPKNSVLLNPSATAEPDIIYIRCIEHFQTYEINHMMIYDGKLRVIPCPSHLLPKNVNLFRGLEDLRVVWHKNRLWFTATSTHATDNMNNEMLLGHFNAALTEVEYLTPLEDISARPAKNICPFVHKGELFLFDCYKSRIFAVPNKKDALPQLIKTLCWPKGQKPLRGSTSPIHLHGNTWGFIAHDIIFNDNTRLVTRLSYIHHWIEMDIERGAVTFVSTPFWIAHWGVEYVSGLRWGGQNKKYVELFFGVNDQMPMMCATSLDNLRIGK